MNQKIIKGNNMKRLQVGMLVTATILASLVAGISAQSSMSTDTRIESTAKDSHVYRTILKDDSINVASNGGVVTLTGTVSSPANKSLAEETVKNEAGVKSVHNRLVVKGLPVEENSDAWIATKVKTTLLFYRNVNGFKTQVAVKDGVVTLQGEADSSAQKELAAEYAKDIDGVKSVNNEMVVKPSENAKETIGEKIDDASITAQVKLALLYHRSTSALKTTVKTIDGKVKLTGQALNAAEKDLVTKLVKDINGVKDVINHMTIATSK
jgi:hyperosmotically inducible protein